MFTHKGKCYIGGLVVLESVIAMLKDLGVAPTEPTLTKLQKHCGTALYAKAVALANEKSVVAQKAEAIVVSALRNFRPGKKTQTLYATWEELSVAAADARAGLAAIIAAVKAMEDADDNVPAGTMSNQLASSPPAVAAADAAYAVYAAELLAQFKSRIKVVGNKGAFGEGAIAYAQNNVALTLATDAVRVEKAEIKTAARRTRGTGTGTRRGFLTPMMIAGIPWSGKWTTMASQLLAAGTIKAEGNFALRPALERCARELKDKTFVFAGGREVTGAQILEDVDAFRTPAAAS